MMKKFIILVCFMYFVSFGFIMPLEDCHDDDVQCTIIRMCEPVQLIKRLRCANGSGKMECYSTRLRSLTTENCKYDSQQPCVPNSEICGEQNCMVELNGNTCSLPEIQQSPAKEVFVTLGFSFTLHCNATGYPYPIISWQRTLGIINRTSDRITITSLNGSGELILKDAQYEDAGQYECIASNAAGKVVATPGAMVIVKDINTCYPNLCHNGATCTYTGPNNYTCTCATGWTGVHCETGFIMPLRDCHDEDVQSKCTIIRMCDPVQLIKRFRCANGSDKMECYFTRLPSLTTENCEYESKQPCVTNSEICGKERCVVELNGNTCSLPEIQQSPAKEVFVTLGFSFTLHCNATGYPYPIISWQRTYGIINRTSDRINIISSNGSGELILKDAQYGDAGHYECIASNAAGKVVATPGAMVIVKAPSCTKCIVCDGQTNTNICLDAIEKTLLTLSDSVGSNPRMENISLPTCNNGKECAGQWQKTGIVERSLKFYPLPDKKCTLPITMVYSTTRLLTCALLPNAYNMEKVPCLDQNTCSPIEDTSRFKGYCINSSLGTYINDVKGHLQKVTPFVYIKYLEIQGLCNVFGYALKPVVKGVAVAKMLENTQKPSPSVDVHFYEKEPQADILWTFSIKPTTTPEDILVTFVSKNTTLPDDFFPPQVNGSNEALMETPVPCSNRSTCIPFKIRSDLQGYCINDDLATYITDVKVHLQKEGPFVYINYFEFYGECNELGYALRPVVRGVAVAEMLENTMKTKSMVEVHFYEREPRANILWTFSIEQTTMPEEINAKIVSKNTTIPLVILRLQVDGSTDALKETSDMTSEKVSASSIAISASVSFLAGIFTVLIALLLLRHVRARKGCFRKDNQSSEGKWEGASQPVTKQVLEQQTADFKSQPADKGKNYSNLNHSNEATEHIYDKSHDTYEDLKDKGNRDSHLYSTTQSQSQYESLSDASAVKYDAGNEHVYTGLAGQSRADKPYDKAENDVERKQDKRRDHLFEESRDSSASAHDYFTLENDNFRHSEQPVDEAKHVNEDGQKEGNQYFTLQKENINGVQTPEKTSSTENEYFTLEKESGKGELTSDTYFNLQMEN